MPLPRISAYNDNRQWLRRRSLLPCRNDSSFVRSHISPLLRHFDAGSKRWNCISGQPRDQDRASTGDFPRCGSKRLVRCVWVAHRDSRRCGEAFHRRRSHRGPHTSRSPGGALSAARVLNEKCRSPRVTWNSRTSGNIRVSCSELAIPLFSTGAIHKGLHLSCSRRSRIPREQGSAAGGS